MHLESLTNSELIRELRDDFSMNLREIILLDRLMSCMDEIDKLTSEVNSLLPEPTDGNAGS